MFQNLFGENRSKKVPEWALEKIKEARETQSLTLFLHGSYGKEPLFTIPNEVFELSNLRHISITDTEISKIPKSITRLRKLSSLRFSDNKIREIPSFLGSLPELNDLYIGEDLVGRIPDWIAERKDWVGLGLEGMELNEIPEWLLQQTKLTRLQITVNHLSSLPAWFANFKNLQLLFIKGGSFSAFPEPILRLLNLTHLSLSQCGITEVPETISELAELKSLGLYMNAIATLPETISELAKLESLDLSRNAIASLPASMAELKNLKVLDLGSNRFQKIPECVFELLSLESLDLGNYLLTGKDQRNTISEVPPEITRLKKLNALDMQHNPMITPPEEVVAKGIDAIREYYRQAQQQGTDELYEAKLLLVGEPGAGKTSLAHKILDPDYVLQPQQPSTKGIDVSPWRFPLENGREFRVNLWDFGGQEIYHATHQYFLTRRSLYLLIVDTRQEDTDYEFWLNVIELLGGDSPVLIIKNEKQERKRELDERHLRGRFPNLKEILATNLETNRGLERIRQTIQYYLRNLPHIGAPLPKSWVMVRAALENDSRYTISLEEYLQTCKKYGFENRADALQLSGYLHDLGVCLHFQEDPLLKHLIILKTQWGTDAAYSVLDNPTVINNLGLFTLTDLQTIWDRPEYQGMFDELLQLMIKFRLCYRIPGNTDRYMAPQLLSLNSPEYTWDENENLYIRYTYEFMPKGMLTQLIVALHERIASDDLVWRTGVVLKDESGLTRAEVIEQYQKREIHIRVSGVEKKELLTIVTYELEKMHGSYVGLKYDALIPCNCNKCHENSKPHFYLLETLKHFIQQRHPDIQCPVSFQMVNVRALIDDVITPVSIDQPVGLMNTIRYDFHAENIYVQTGSVDQRRIDIDTAGGAFIGGSANVGGDLVGRDQQQITFTQVYEAIQNNPQIKTEDKPQLQKVVKDIEEELRKGGETPNEGFLKQRFQNIAAMAPDILDVALAAATNPVVGFTEAARKIAKRAAHQAKTDS